MWFYTTWMDIWDYIPWGVSPLLVQNWTKNFHPWMPESFCMLQVRLQSKRAHCDHMATNYRTATTGVISWWLTIKTCWMWLALEAFRNQFVIAGSPTWLNVKNVCYGWLRFQWKPYDETCLKLGVPHKREQPLSYKTNKIIKKFIINCRMYPLKPGL